MKLDKIQFAMVIAQVSDMVRRQNIDIHDIQVLDDLIYIGVPDSNKANVSDVDELLRQLKAYDGFIPAIKAYSVLTGVGWKEAKDAIVRYRNIPKFSKGDS